MAGNDNFERHVIPNAVGLCSSLGLLLLIGWLRYTYENEYVSGAAYVLGSDWNTSIIKLLVYIFFGLLAYAGLPIGGFIIGRDLARKLIKKYLS